MLFVLIESATYEISKTGLGLKIGQAVTKLWMKCQTLSKIVYGEIVYSYGEMLFYASRQCEPFFYIQQNQTKSFLIKFINVFQ